MDSLLVSTEPPFPSSPLLQSAIENHQLSIQKALAPVPVAWYHVSCSEVKGTRMLEVWRMQLQAMY
jgi:hypothetical protein